MEREPPPAMLGNGRLKVLGERESVETLEVQFLELSNKAPN